MSTSNIKTVMGAIVEIGRGGEVVVMVGRVKG